MSNQASNSKGSKAKVSPNTYFSKLIANNSSNSGDLLSQIVDKISSNMREMISKKDCDQLDDLMVSALSEELDKGNLDVTARSVVKLLLLLDPTNCYKMFQEFGKLKPPRVRAKMSLEVRMVRKLQKLEREIVDLNNESDEEDELSNNPAYISIVAKYTNLYKKYQKLYAASNESLNVSCIAADLDLADVSPHANLNITIQKLLDDLLNPIRCGEKSVKHFKPPTFDMILKITEEHNKDDKLELNEDTVFELAADVYHKIIQILKSRRVQDMWNSILCEVFIEADPAEKNSKLDAQLRNNEIIAKRNFDQVISEFAKRQGNASNAKAEENSENETESEDENQKEWEELEDESLENSTSNNSDISMISIDEAISKKNLETSNSHHQENDDLEINETVSKIVQALDDSPLFEASDENEVAEVIPGGGRKRRLRIRAKPLCKSCSEH